MENEASKTNRMQGSPRHAMEAKRRIGPGQDYGRRIGVDEELISLTEATKCLPRVDGKKPAVCTLWRWCRKGLRGQFLEYVRVGRKICTTREALLRFFANLALADRQLEDSPPVNPVITHNQRFLSKGRRSARARQRSIEEADAILEEAGI